MTQIAQMNKMRFIGRVYCAAVGDTIAVRPDEKFDLDAVRAYLRGQLPEIEAVKQFPGGHSNLTYLLRCVDGGEYVLRRPPLGPVAPKAHDMAREFRVLTAVHPVFPLAPQPFLLCEDAAVVGAVFYVMERRRGVVVRRDMPAELVGQAFLPVRISEAIVDTLVTLHSIDVTAPPLAGLGKPQGFVERQVAGWAERWQRAKTSEVPAIDRVVAWLHARIPPLPRATLVHNDYKLDNVMLAPSDPARVVAVLDWEMATLGDPLVDLGLLLCYWSQAGDPEARRDSISSVTTEPGWFTRAQILERYAARTGADLSNVAFYEAFALFKVAVVLQQIFFRYHRGQTKDARFADFDRRVAGPAEAALEVMQNEN